jgi:hypothetical protein
MKQILKPVIPHLSEKKQDDPKEKGSIITNSIPELGPIQKDRSFLPISHGKPVHKCGCT